MWELVSFMLAMGVLLFILNYLMDPRQLIEDIKALKGSTSKIEELERRIEELEKALQSNNQNQTGTNG